MDLLAEIKGIKYTPLLSRELDIFDFKDLEEALSSKGTFLLRITKENKVAVSWWVSPKRTRSYPYARVYDSLRLHRKEDNYNPRYQRRGERRRQRFLAMGYSVIDEFVRSLCNYWLLQQCQKK